MGLLSGQCLPETPALPRADAARAYLWKTMIFCGKRRETAKNEISEQTYFPHCFHILIYMVFKKVSTAFQHGFEQIHMISTKLSTKLIFEEKRLWKTEKSAQFLREPNEIFSGRRRESARKMRIVENFLT